MGVNSLPKTVTRQRRGCDLNLDPSAPEYQHANHSATEPPQTWDICGLCMREGLINFQLVCQGKVYGYNSARGI